MSLPTDTGPLVALVNSREKAHEVCWRVLMTQPESVGGMVTTWACFTEAMHILGRDGGYALQSALLRLLESGRLRLYTPQEGESARAAALVRHYANIPCDFADASVISLCEATGARKVFTLDSDFYVYRLADGTALSVVPDNAARNGVG